MSAPVPESREYDHRTCGVGTCVDGPEFSAVADPLSHPARTICMECNAAFPVEEFEWSDTGEGLADYYARHRARCSPISRFLGSRNAFFALLAWGVGFAVLVAFLLVGPLGLGAAIGIGVVLGLVDCVAAVIVWDGPLKRGVLLRDLGVEDARQLT